MQPINLKDFFTQAGVDIDYATEVILAALDGKLPKKSATHEIERLRELGYQFMLIAANMGNCDDVE